MPSTRWIAVAAVVAVGLVHAPTVAAHTNHVEADPQVAAGDRVRVEAVFPATDGWLVVHRVNASGGIGEPVGHVAVDRGDGFRTDVPVPVAGNATSNRTLLAALHHEDGGSGFDPDDDPIVTSFGEPVTSRFAVETGAAPAYVGAEGFGALPVRDGTVRVRRVDLARDGSVAVRRNATGAVLASTDLEAGTHRNVTVAVDAETLPTREPVLLRATVHADDGPVRVGGEPVATVYAVERTPLADGDAAGPPIPAAGVVATAAALAVAAKRRQDGDV